MTFNLWPSSMVRSTNTGLCTSSVNDCTHRSKSINQIFLIAYNHKAKRTFCFAFLPSKLLYNLLCRPVYAQIQIQILKVFLEKLEYFQFFRHREVLFINVVFAAKGYWEVWAAILAVCKRFGNTNSAMPRSDLYLNRNTFSLTALALSPSVLSISFCSQWK